MLVRKFAWTFVVLGFVLYFILAFAFEKECNELIGGFFVLIAAFIGVDQWRDQLRSRGLEKVENTLIVLHRCVAVIFDLTSPAIRYDDPNETDPVKKAAFNRNKLVEDHKEWLEKLDNLVYEIELYAPDSIRDRFQDVKKILIDIQIAHRQWLFFLSMKHHAYSKELAENFAKAFLLDEGQKASLHKLEGLIISEKVNIRNEYYNLKSNKNSDEKAT